MTRNILIGLVVVALVAGGWWYFNQSSAPTTSETAQQNTNTGSEKNTKPSGPSTQSKLAIDLTSITPQFIDGGTSLSSQLLGKIEADIIAILVAKEPENHQYYSQNGIALSAVGKRYVAFRVLRPTDNPAPLQIIDSTTQKSDNYISGQLLFKTNKVAVYVDGQNIYTYKPDQPSAVPLSGAKLSGNETYDHCGGCMAGNQDLQATHTDDSFTISTYDWTQSDKTSLPYKPKKVRDLTFTLP